MNIENQMRSAARHLRKEVKDIPALLLKHAKGIVFLTMVKGAFIWSGSLSTGIVVKRLGPNEWSPPCSLGMASFGFGLQAGGEKVDVIIVIGDEEEIDTFAGTGQLKLGVEYGLAAGPIGRDIDLSAYIGRRGLTCSMYYSRSKGLFAGFSLEGAVLVSRWMANNSFFGAKVKVKDVLNGKVKVPDHKQTLVDDFHKTMLDFEYGRLDTKIGPGYSSLTSVKSNPGAMSSAAAQSLEEDEEDKAEKELLLRFSTLGDTGKQLLKTSLENGAQRVQFVRDHVVDESDPTNIAYSIISALQGDTAIILDGTLESGMAAPLNDYVRVRVTHSGLEREGLVSRHVLQIMQ